MNELQTTTGKPFRISEFKTTEWRLGGGWATPPTRTADTAKDLATIDGSSIADVFTTVRPPGLGGPRHQGRHPGVAGSDDHTKAGS